jgi:putative intracellular protease/amidase
LLSAKQLVVTDDVGMKPRDRERTVDAARVLIVIPSRDFDPTEVAVSWQVLTQAGLQVVFATPDGHPGAADPLMLSGEGLDLWGFIPGLKRLKLIGLTLRADSVARRAHSLMLQSPAFFQPLKYAELDAQACDALLLPGGHAAGMRAYLESMALQRLVAQFFDAGKPVGAICHGVVLAARSISPLTGRSVLHGRKTTALTWKLERTAWKLMRFLGRVWDPAYYRTYLEQPGEAEGFRSVEAEVRRALASPLDFKDVPRDSPHRFRQASGLFRDRPNDTRCAFVVEDGNYVSARWPGDVHLFAQTLARRVAR